MQMKQWIHALAITTTLTAGVVLASPDFRAERSLYDGSGGVISPTLHFSEVESGDLYLATLVGGEYLFLSEGGGFGTEALPLMAGGRFEGSVALPTFDTTGIPAGRYPLYQVLVVEGGSVYDFSDWVGGFSALNQLNFTIGLPVELGMDRDGDGWMDTDLDHDGYHDDDHDRDGYHDDDHDRDGYHDDDHDRDGYHDDDHDRDGYHDDDHDRDGYHDDDHDRDGYHDDDQAGYSEGYLDHDDDPDDDDGWDDDRDDDRYGDWDDDDRYDDDRYDHDDDD